MPTRQGRTTHEMTAKCLKNRMTLELFVDACLSVLSKVEWVLWQIDINWVKLDKLNFNVLLCSYTFAKNTQYTYTAHVAMANEIHYQFTSCVQRWMQQDIAVTILAFIVLLFRVQLWVLNQHSVLFNADVLPGFGLVTSWKNDAFLAPIQYDVQIQLECI